MAGLTLQEVESDRKTALSQSDKTYDNMINQSDDYYQAQIDASKQWAEQQAQIQQQKTDFAIQQIEQQKDQTTKEYKREQSGAYVDWQKESNRYGVNAEQMASAGFMNSGYSESSQVSMYNTYQNRVSRARESYNLAIQNYNNKITEARLQNNAILAEIAYNALQQQLELSLQGFQYQNTLVQAKIGQQNTINSRYDSQYKTVLDDIYRQQALAEEKRQFDIMNTPQEVVSYKGSGGSSGGGSAKASTKNPLIKATSGYANTGKVTSVRSADAQKYGTFSNGYQPKGIDDEGKVSKTGDKVIVNGKTQNLWQTPNGKYWVWDGSQRDYKQVSKPSSSKGGAVAYGAVSTLFKK